MPLQSVEPRRLYRQIADQIREAIAAGEFPPGSRLPAERDLSAQLKVSRTSVREALIALEIAGLVEIRMGSGVYVSVPPGSFPTLEDVSDTGPGPFETLQARIILEGEIAGCAATMISDAGLNRLKGTINDLRACSANKLLRDEADRSFHLCIAEATANSVLVETVRTYWEQHRGLMWMKIEEHFHTPELLAAVIADHETILAALSARDASGSRQAMRSHLDHIMREFAKGWKARENDIDTALELPRKGRPR